MGCVESNETKKSQEIDKNLEEAKKKLANEIKLLLLGAGESGKTTIQKQIKMIYLDGFTEEEMSSFRLPVFNNVCVCMRALIKAVNEFEYELDDKAKEACSIITKDEYDTIESDLPTEFIDSVKLLWSNDSIKKAYDRQAEFQLYDCASYLFNAIDRIGANGYVPTTEDILRVRTKTTGFTETIFDYSGNTFKLVDVGGQRNERKKWLYCFQDVTSVLFVVSLSEYDLKLYEDNTTNRMQESFKLFKEISNSKYFTNSSIILFLNKSDLFREKIKISPLENFFPEYKGGDDFEQASNFISEKFQELSTKMVFVHVTCATDSSNIKTVFESVRTTIINNLTSNNQTI